MNKYNRDLLVLFREESNPQSIENEVGSLHDMLSYVEKRENLVTAHEVINVNKRKIYSDRKTLQKVVMQETLKPFIFLNNLN